MENTADLLQIEIAKARQQLSKETRDAIDAVSWKSILLTMNTKYSYKQIESLEIETELLLSGMISTKDYPKELENRMGLPSNEVNTLISELDKLIFKKIQEELEKRMVGKEKVIEIKKPLVFESSFANIPNDTQEAIARSNWKEKLYKIGQNYNLSIEKLGVLEEITTGTLSGKISTTQFENEIRSKINISEDKIKDFISEINNFVFKDIKNIMQNIEPKSTTDNIVVPLPPYKQKGVVEKTNSTSFIEDKPKNIEVSSIKNEDFDLDNLKSNDSDMYREHGIEIISDSVRSPYEETKISSGYVMENKKVEIKNEIEKTPIQNNYINVSNPIEETKIERSNYINVSKPVESNIISDKLFNKTTSQTTVMDYSLPKINPQSVDINTMKGSTPSKPHDPYHEAI